MAFIAKQKAAFHIFIRILFYLWCFILKLVKDYLKRSLLDWHLGQNAIAK